MKRKVIIQELLKHRGITPMLDKAREKFMSDSFQDQAFTRSSFLTPRDINHIEHELTSIKHTVECCLEFIQNRRAAGLGTMDQVPPSINRDTVQLDSQVNRLCDFTRQKVSQHEASMRVLDDLILELFEEEVKAVHDVEHFLSYHEPEDPFYQGDLVLLEKQGLHICRGRRDGKMMFTPFGKSKEVSVEYEDYKITGRNHWFHDIRNAVLDELSLEV